MLKRVFFIFYCEIILLLRQSKEWLYPLGFFLIVITLFPIGISPDPEFSQKFIANFIWIAALLASFIAIENVFATDIEDAYLDQMLLGPLPLTVHLYAKFFAQWLVTQLPLILLSPAICWLFKVPVATILVLIQSLLLGTPILILMGGLGVVLTLNLRQQGVLLALLVLPLLIPILILGITIVQQSQAGFSVNGPLTFLAGIFILSLTCLPWTIALTLRLSLEDL